MKKILYISTNDGSDMRINKEIKTLARYAEVYFLGVGEYGDKNYAKSNCPVCVRIAHWQALVTVNATAALERAGAADAATRRGESWGPLHGVPFAAPVAIPDPDT